MKKTLILLILFLSACNAGEEPQNVTGHQSLQAIPTGNLPPTPISPSMPVEVLSPQEGFANQQEFISLMLDKLTALEGTLILLDANLSEALNADDPNALLALRDFMIAGVREEQGVVANLTPYGPEVEALQNYVALALHYNMEQKAAEFEIFSAESLETRSQLLNGNAENERLAAHYITQAWAELNNLSASPIYQK